MQLEPLKKKADMFRNVDKDSLSDTHLPANDLNHLLPGYKTLKSRISPCNITEQQSVKM
jgi:hypothetical protein